FEPITACVQSLPSTYQIDICRRIIASAERLAGKRFGADPREDVSLQVIADHARAVTFMIAEGIVPSNEGRGYVLRRLLRRAARHGKLLGLGKPFLHEVVREGVATMGAAYPEIAQAEIAIREVVRAEEERFAVTLDRGLALLAGEVERARQAGGTTLPGDVAFKLYDTYGFPLDLTEDILAGEGMVVDRAGFDLAMEGQRERGRAAQRFADATAAPELLEKSHATRFVGDRIAEWESEVLALLVGNESRPVAREGEDVGVITAETPFYAESGGQVGDRGWLVTDGARVEVLDTHKIAPTVVVHR